MTSSRVPQGHGPVAQPKQSAHMWLMSASLVSERRHASDTQPINVAYRYHVILATPTGFQITAWASEIYKAESLPFKRCPRRGITASVVKHCIPECCKNGKTVSVCRRSIEKH